MEQLYRLCREMWHYHSLTLIILAFTLGFFFAILILSTGLSFTSGQKASLETIFDKVDREFLSVFSAVIATVFGLAISLAPSLISGFLDKYGSDKIRATFLGEESYKSLKRMFGFWIIASLLSLVIYDNLNWQHRATLVVCFSMAFVVSITLFYRFINSIELYIMNADRHIGNVLLRNAEKIIDDAGKN